MAVYECFDSFTAFGYLLRDSGPELEPAARLLVSEFCKYTLDRAWFYYPDALPPELLASDNRNGHIDRALSFPLEDLSADGQPAGQVGQEIYGAGAAMIFASRAFHHVEGAAFRLFCDQFVLSSERTGNRAISLRLDGGENCTAMLRLIRLKGRTLPEFSLSTSTGEAIKPLATDADRVDFEAPASGGLILTWRE
jgi:hypothetical protein